MTCIVVSSHDEYSQVTCGACLGAQDSQGMQELQNAIFWNWRHHPLEIPTRARNGDCRAGKSTKATPEARVDGLMPCFDDSKADLRSHMIP